MNSSTIDVLVTAKQVQSHPSNPTALYNLIVSVPHRTGSGGSTVSTPISLDQAQVVADAYTTLLATRRAPAEPPLAPAQVANLYDVAAAVRTTPVQPDDASLRHFRDACRHFWEAWMTHVDISAPPSPADHAELLAVGRQMHRLFPADTLAEIVATLHEARRNHQRLRLIVAIDARLPELTRVPWEVLLLPLDDQPPTIQHLLGLQPDVAIVRHVREQVVHQPISLDATSMAHVVVSQALTDVPLFADLCRARIAAAAPGCTVWHTTPDTLATIEQVIAQQQPQILHLICHGMVVPKHDGRTAVELVGSAMIDGHLTTRLLRADQVARALHGASRLQMVLLLVCHSGGQSDGAARDDVRSWAQQLVRLGVPAVLALQGEMSQEQGARFCAAWYAALASGTAYDHAVTTARLALADADWRFDWSVPVLYTAAHYPQPPAWTERGIARLDRWLFSERWLVQWRATLRLALLLLLLGALARWLVGSPVAVQAAWVWQGLWLWTLAGSITGLVLLLWPQPFVLPRHVVRTRQAGALLGYALGGWLGLLLPLTLLLLAEWLPAWVWWLVVALIIGWSLLFGAVVGWRMGRSAERLAEPYHPDLFDARTLLIVGSAALIAGLFPWVLRWMLDSLFGPHTLLLMLRHGLVSAAYAGGGLALLAALQRDRWRWLRPPDESAP